MLLISIDLYCRRVTSRAFQGFDTTSSLKSFFLTMPESACYTSIYNLTDNHPSNTSPTRIIAMATERREQGSTRQNILQLLRRQGQMTALELSSVLDIGAVGVRQHLALLERDGLVCIAGLRRNIGRPSHLYVLTEEAEQHFPKKYDQLSLDLLDYLASLGGDEAIEQAFRMRRQALCQSLAPRLAGKPLDERVAELSQILIEQGYMCEYEQLDDGSFLLTEHNCPVICVARCYPQICDQEMELYEELLGVAIERDMIITQGDLCCRYRIPA
ncbi:MAG: transcriptional regulator [Chloroflexales bacterium]|nr:transcriptional regulator [Chloroflexales bacterium]